MLFANQSCGSTSAPSALLVHGVGASRATCRRFGPWLAGRGFQAIAVDLRGHGKSRIQSEPQRRDRSLSSVAADLVETMASLRPDVEGSNSSSGTRSVRWFEQSERKALCDATVAAQTNRA
ncbi:alpha/beta hydrolase [Nocardioides sp. KIGAM211]|uniref:Alpha/beta hydrolase n=1 Tax=Nocardioides luti TaxID=2761101 RepID=A0A7X0VAP4_9ACTN|nr:alpha/beta hydrolase [Nocardioides luti]